MVRQSSKLACRGSIKIHLGLRSKVKPRDEARTLGNASGCDNHKQESAKELLTARSRIARKIAEKSLEIYCDLAVSTDSSMRTRQLHPGEYWFSTRYPSARSGESVKRMNNDELDELGGTEKT